MSSILMTGDFHGNYDKFSFLYISPELRPKAGDYLAINGDCGMIFAPSGSAEAIDCWLRMIRGLSGMSVSRGNFFTAPYETHHSLRERLSRIYEITGVTAVGGIGCFRCRK